MRIGRGTHNDDVRMHVMTKDKNGLGDCIEMIYGQSSANIRTSGFPERIGSTALDAYRSTILDNQTDVAYFPGAEAIKDSRVLFQEADGYLRQGQSILSVESIAFCFF
jgi:hypothetical protein